MKSSFVIVASVLAKAFYLSCASVPGTAPSNTAQLQTVVGPLDAQIQYLGNGYHVHLNNRQHLSDENSPRRLEFSEECASETQEIAFNEDLLAALYGLNEHCPTHFTQEPPITVTSDFTKCDNDAVTEFRLACSNAGGQHYDQNLNMRCDINGQTLQVVFVDFPECVGMSCGESEINTYKEEAFVAVVETLAIQFPGITCSQTEFIEMVETVEIDGIEEIQQVSVEFEDTEDEEGSFDFESSDAVETTDGEDVIDIEDEDVGGEGSNDPPVEGSNDPPATQVMDEDEDPSSSSRVALSTLATGLVCALVSFL